MCAIDTTDVVAFVTIIFPFLVPQEKKGKKRKKKLREGSGYFCFAKSSDNSSIEKCIYSNYTTVRDEKKLILQFLNFISIKKNEKYIILSYFSLFLALMLMIIFGFYC